MIRFDVYRPKNVADALNALKYYGESMIPLAGGTDVLVLMRDRKVSVRRLLDLWVLRRELAYVKVEGGVVRIGAMTTVSDLCSEEVLLKDRRLAIIKDVCKGFATPYLRNLATIGGNIGTSHPLSDFSVALLTLNASVKLESVDGERWVPLTEFFTGLRKNVRRPEELITEIMFELPVENTSSAFLKFDRRWGHAMGYILTGASMTLRDGIVNDVRIAFDSVSHPYPERAFKTEEFLRGKEFTEDTVRKAVDEVLPTEMIRIDDYRASAEYRLELSKVLLRRVLFKIKERLGG